MFSAWLLVKVKSACSESLRRPFLPGHCIRSTGQNAEMDPMKAQQLAAELEVEMMADMYNRSVLAMQASPK